MNHITAWTIAGSDSSGLAGIQADIKTMSRLGVQVCSVITAVTAQNRSQLTDIQFIDIEAQLKILNRPHAIKLGMLGKQSIIKSVSDYLQENPVPTILDPVMISTSGEKLFHAQSCDYSTQLQTLFSHVELITPNIPEAEIMLKRPIKNYAQIEQAAQDLIAMGVASVLIKGGHYLDDAFSQDFWTNGKEAFWIASERYPQSGFRGTGCTLSSAITAARALGHDIKDAIVMGKMVINQAMHLSVNAQLYHSTFPTEQKYLPYIASTPITEHPEPFKDCGKNSMGLYPIVDRAEWLNILLPLGVKTVQLRIKDLQGEQLIAEIQTAIAIANKYDANLYINDYWELAIRFEAYGVHLGQDDIASADVNAIRKSGLRLGISTHGYYEVARAHAFNPSYIAFGAIYETTLKKMIPQGLEKLQYWNQLLNYPVIAIGGMTLERIAEVMATGVNGVALISAITQADNPVAATKNLLAEMDKRYSQQIKLGNFGADGQQKLKQARVLCVGVGGLAAPFLLYCAAAGVGTLGIVDDDQVELSNLQRQVLFATSQIGSAKVDAAKQNISALNPHVNVEVHPVRFTEENARDLISSYDIIVDCTDNFFTKYLINDVCFGNEKPFVYASVSQYTGQCAVFDGKTAPSFRELFPSQPGWNLTLDCRQGGVLGVLPGLLGVIQATEVLKWILNLGDSLCGSLLVVDLLHMKFKKYQLS